MRLSVRNLSQGHLVVELDTPQDLPSIYTFNLRTCWIFLAHLPCPSGRLVPQGRAEEMCSGCAGAGRRMDGQIDKLGDSEEELRVQVRRRARRGGWGEHQVLWPLPGTAPACVCSQTQELGHLPSLHRGVNRSWPDSTSCATLVQL